MAVDVFAPVRQAIRIKLQDTAGIYWTDDELDQYINDAQYDFALRTKTLLKSLPILNLENSEIYNFPEDFMELVRLTDKNGDEIELTNWKWLRNQYGERFHKTTSELPRYAYTDLTPKSKFRMYPTPKPKVLASMTEFDLYSSGYIIQDLNNILLLMAQDNGFLVYADGEVFVSDEGIISDIVPDDDTVLFDGEEGAICQVIDTEESCILWYTRKPNADVLEYTYTLPLVYYSVMQAYLKEADMQNFAKAQVFQQLYQTEVNRINGRKTHARPVLHNE